MKYRISVSDFVFYSAYVLYYLAIFVTYTAIPYSEVLKRGMAFFTVCLLGFNLLIHVHGECRLPKLKHTIILLAFFAISCLSIVYKDFFIIVLILFYLNIKRCKIDINLLLKVSCFVLIVATLIVLFLCVIGVLENRITLRSRNANEDRFALGFYHSNVLPNIVLYCWCYYFVDRQKISVINFWAAFITSVIVYLLCDSRNSFFSALILLILLAIYEIKSRKVKTKKMIIQVSNLAYVFFSLVSFILLLLYKQRNIIGIVADKLLSGRLYMGNLYYRFQNIRFIQLMTSDYFKKILLTLDNGYYYSVARYGIIYLLFLCGLMYFGSSFFRFKRNYYALIIISVLAFTNFIDNCFFAFHFYPFILISMYGYVNKNRVDVKTSLGN